MRLQNTCSALLSVRSRKCPTTRRPELTPLARARERLSWPRCSESQKMAGAPELRARTTASLTQSWMGLSFVWHMRQMSPVLTSWVKTTESSPRSTTLTVPSAGMMKVLSWEPCVGVCRGSNGVGRPQTLRRLHGLHRANGLFRHVTCKPWLAPMAWPGRLAGAPALLLGVRRCCGSQSKGWTWSAPVSANTGCGPLTDSFQKPDPDQTANCPPHGVTEPMA